MAEINCMTCGGVDNCEGIRKKDCLQFNYKYWKAKPEASAEHERITEGEGVHSVDDKLTITEDALIAMTAKYFEEHDIRIKYQDIVYKICALFDQPKTKNPCTVDEVYSKVKGLQVYSKMNNEEKMDVLFKNLNEIEAKREDKK
jgi:DNA modification methylase